MLLDKEKLLSNHPEIYSYKNSGTFDSSLFIKKYILSEFFKVLSKYLDINFVYF